MLDTREVLALPLFHGHQHSSVEVRVINGVSFVQTLKSVNKTFAELVETVWLLVLHRGAES